MQFLIVGEQATVSDGNNPDPGVTQTWKFIAEHWKLAKPKLIISVIYDIEKSFMNRRLLESILADLVKAATAVKGKNVW